MKGVSDNVKPGKGNRPSCPRRDAIGVSVAEVGFTLDVKVCFAEGLNVCFSTFSLFGTTVLLYISLLNPTS